MRYSFPKDALFCFLLPFEDQAAGKPEHSAILLLKFFFFFHTGSSLLCEGFSLVAVSGGYSLVAVHGLLIAETYLVVEPGL